MTGFLFVAAVLIACAMLAFRIAPAVVEYYSVKRALGESLREVKDPTSVGDVRRAFEARFTAKRMAQQYLVAYEQLLLLRNASDTCRRQEPGSSSRREPTEQKHGLLSSSLAVAPISASGGT